MDHKVIWSQQAREDLREIVSFIAPNNPAGAESFALWVMNTADDLAEDPHIGDPVPELADESIREVVLRPYRLIYKVPPAAHHAAIARVWHGSLGTPDGH